MEYQLCKQLLRVSGAVPDRPDSEEDLTESETEEGSEPEIVIKVISSQSSTSLSTLI
jgi:hypothetical protein